MKTQKITWNELKEKFNQPNERLIGAIANESYSLIEGKGENKKVTITTTVMPCHMVVENNKIVGVKPVDNCEPIIITEEKDWFYLSNVLISKINESYKNHGVQYQKFNNIEKTWNIKKALDCRIILQNNVICYAE